MDERHICFADVPTIATYLRENHPHIEYNVECENHPRLIEMICELQPHQCTLVPVTPGEVTSDHGFQFPNDGDELTPTIEKLKTHNIRVSLFADCIPNSIRSFSEVGADRVELYTGPYAWAWATSQQRAQQELVAASAQAAGEYGMRVNAGHDLDRHNLPGLANIPNLVEVSIGHAQICRALEVGTTQSVQELLQALSR
jgi:pyridoxine 5-phosphate synthase